jgi:RNA 2',3'-cyclic 3'-phosphodiesterase
VIRAFIAVCIDPRTLKNVLAVTSQLKRRIPDVRWVAKENLHLTLKFLGQIDEDLVEPISRMLEVAIRPFPRFTINAKGLGVFPAFEQPRILWVGLGGTELISLASEIDSTLEALGFEREKRSFKAHLTIGRWRHFEGSATRLRNELEEWKNYQFGESRVEELTLFQSITKPEGAVYRSLKSVALAGEYKL